METAHADAGTLGARPSATANVRVLLAASVVMIVTFLSFERSLHSDFVMWDDDINIYSNPHVQGLNWANLTWMFLDVKQALRYKPLTWLGWSLVHEVCGLNPLGYHLLNVVFHSANALLIFFLLLKLVRFGLEKGPNQPSWFVLLSCALGAWLWALHPLRVEPVAWVTGLPYGQALFFLLLCFLAYLSSNDSSRSVRMKRLLYWVSVGAFTLSMLSYPIVVTAVAVLVFFDLYPLRRVRLGGDGWRAPEAAKVLKEKLPFLVVAVAFGGLTLAGRVRGSEHFSEAASLGDSHWLSRVMQAFFVWAWYLWKQWLPTNLSPFYTRLIDFQPLEPVFLASAIAIVGISLLLVIWRSRCGAVLGIWLCYLVLLAPALGLTETLPFTSDRYAHVVSIGWSVLVTVALVKTGWNQRKGLLAALAVASIVVVFQSMSSRQIAVWHDTAALLAHTIRANEGSPYCAPLFWRLGKFYAMRKQWDLASEAQSEAVRLRPRWSQARTDLADALLELGNRDGALKQYLQAAGTDPQAFVPRCQAAILLAQDGHVAEASDLRNQLKLLARGNLAAATEARLLDALASGHAKNGQLSDAVRTATEALAAAQASGEPALVELIRTKLARYVEASENR